MRPLAIARIPSSSGLGKLRFAIMPHTVVSIDEIRAILVRRIDQQKQALGIVVGVVEPDGRRIVAYGSLASGDPRTLDGDTIFEIGSVSKVCLLYTSPSPR